MKKIKKYWREEKTYRDWESEPGAVYTAEFTKPVLAEVVGKSVEDAEDFVIGSIEGYIASKRNDWIRLVKNFENATIDKREEGDRVVFSGEYWVNERRVVVEYILELG